MKLNTALRISLLGIGVETVGLILDILHHLSIGLETPEGLLNFNHATVFVGFLITAVGVLMSTRRV
mgnify:CR=1 FL=1